LLDARLENVREITFKSIIFVVVQFILFYPSDGQLLLLLLLLVGVVVMMSKSMYVIATKRCEISIKTSQEYRQLTLSWFLSRRGSKYVFVLGMSPS